MFRLRRDVRPWFKDIHRAFAVDFDMYYLCLMAGLAARRTESSGDAADLIDHFPAIYQPRARLVVALFLKTELEVAGVQMNERDAVRTSVRALISTSSPTLLSDQGIKAMNLYCNGGFDCLTEWFDDRPRTIETFLPLYKKYLAEEMAKSEGAGP